MFLSNSRHSNCQKKNLTCKELFCLLSTIAWVDFDRKLPLRELIVVLHKFFSLKHPAKYIGKKPRKYTIPAKPLAPTLPGPDQVRIYSASNTGDGAGLMQHTHSSQYLRVRLGHVALRMCSWAVWFVSSSSINTFYIFSSKLAVTFLI